MSDPRPQPPAPAPDATPVSPPATPGESVPGTVRSVEIGGRKGPEPTRYGDWEKDGRCIDF